ncbi:MAG: response regulator [Bacteroidia bacterium]|jgi:DNA-binding NarL/FixJ family response regulator
MTSIVIFDDNPGRRESLRMLLESHKEFIVTGDFEDCSKVKAQIEQLQPDVVLMDIQMPLVDGLEGVRIIKEYFPNIHVIMQTVFEDDEKIFDAMRYGASGYILKKTDPRQIIQAIEEVRNGGSPMTPSIATRVLHFFRQQHESKPETYGLSEREREILQYLVNGLSYKMIADKLEISYNTVNSHIKKIYDKLQVHSVSEAVSKAIRSNIIR